MLLAINDKAKGILGYIIIALIAVPFALWGIQSYITDDAPRYIAKVDDREISLNEFSRILTNFRQRMQDIYKGKPPIEDSVIKNQVMEGLIEKHIIEKRAVELGYRISDASLFGEISRNENFQRDGQFDRERYETILQANSIRPAEYENGLRSELSAKQLKNSISLSSFATGSEIERHASTINELRTFSYIIFDSENVASDLVITDDEKKNFYDQNAELFTEPEQISVDYIELKIGDLETSVVIDEQAILDMYSDYEASVGATEERRARHILIKKADDALARLEGIETKVAAGTAFDELAKEYSEDIGSAAQGGDLDWITRDQMPKAFEDALYGLKEGEISEVVETRFGYHLIKLEAIRSEELKPLADMREQFEEEIRRDVLGNAFYELSENLAALAYENIDSLAVAAETLDLKVQTSDFFSRGATDGIAKDPLVRDAAFSEAVYERGENSDTIELVPGEHVIVLRLNDRRSPVLKPFEQVSDIVEKRLAVLKESEKVADAAKEGAKKVSDGQSMASLTSDGSRLDLVEVASVIRTDVEAAPPQVMQRAFKLDPGSESVDVVPMGAGRYALVKLEAVRTPEALEKKLLDDSKRFITEQRSSIEVDGMVKNLSSGIDIYRNKKLLEEQ